MGAVIKQTSFIIDQLFLGGERSSKEKKTLVGLNVKVIVNVTNDVKCSFEGEKLFVYKTILIADKPLANMGKHFEETCQFIHENILAGKTVLVHCKGGRSRSATMILAYLVTHQGYSLKDAYLHVRSKRSIIAPNIGFWKQLVEYEKKIRGENSVNMLETGIGPWPDILGPPL